MIRLIAAAAILTLFSGCATTDRTLGARLDALVSDLHQRNLFDGAVVIGVRDQVVWEKGFGLANVESATRFTPATAADGGSLAKTMTAAILLELESEGKLSLDEPVQKYLPELPYRQLSLRHLISHTNGLPDYGYFDAYLKPDVVRTTEGLLEVLAREKPRLAFSPGTAFEYSSLGFDLALLAAARSAGEPYARLLAKRFLEPLGMDTAFLRPGRFHEFPGVRTRGYKRTAAGLEPNEVFDFEAFHGGSNIYLSARDLHRWGARPIRTKALERAQINAHSSGLALGSWYQSADGSSYWYSGHLNGFHSELFRDTDRGISIAYISNNTMPIWLQKGLVRAIRSILEGEEPGTLAPPGVSEIKTEALPTLAGTWGEFAIAWNGTFLTISGDDVAYRMVQVEPRLFYVPGLDFTIGFAADQMYLSTSLSESWISRR